MTDASPTADLSRTPLAGDPFGSGAAASRYDPGALRVDLYGNPTERNPYFPDPNDPTLTGDRIMHHLAFGAQPEDFHPALQTVALGYGAAFQPQPPRVPGLLGSAEQIRQAMAQASPRRPLRADDPGVVMGLDTVDNENGSDQPVDAQAEEGTQDAGAGPTVSSHSVFNSAKAAQYMRDHALAKSAEQCARYVRRGLAAGGLNTDGHPIDAKDYGPFLKSRGASVVDPKNYQPRQGDVVVYDGNAQHKHGHIQVYDGSEWISDFRQRAVSPYRSNEPGRTIYRFPTQ